MAKERAKAGARALGDWLKRCTAAVGEVKGSTFMKLMEMLVESVLLYGAEVWGCGGQLKPVDVFYPRIRILTPPPPLRPMMSNEDGSAKGVIIP